MSLKELAEIVKELLSRVDALSSQFDMLSTQFEVLNARVDILTWLVGFILAAIIGFGVAGIIRERRNRR